MKTESYGFEIEFDPAPLDLLRANLSQWKGLMVFLLSVFSVCFSILLVVLLFKGVSLPEAMPSIYAEFRGVLIVFLGFLPIICVLLVISGWWKSRYSQLVKGKHKYRTSEDSLLMKGNNFEVKLAWKSVTKLIDSKFGILIKFGFCSATFIPKRAFIDSGEQAKFKEYVHEKIE